MYTILWKQKIKTRTASRDKGKTSGFKDETVL